MEICGSRLHSSLRLSPPVVPRRGWHLHVAALSRRPHGNKGLGSTAWDDNAAVPKGLTGANCSSRSNSMRPAAKSMHWRHPVGQCVHPDISGSSTGLVAWVCYGLLSLLSCLQGFCIKGRLLLTYISRDRFCRSFDLLWGICLEHLLHLHSLHS